MAAKNSKPGLRFGVILALITVLLAGCASPAGALVVQPSLLPATGLQAA